MIILQKKDGHYYHHQIEAMKQAFSDATAYVSDSSHMKVTSGDMLDVEYLRERRKDIDAYAQERVHGELPKGGTVYLATADNEGNMVSYIFRATIWASAQVLSFRKQGLHFRTGDIISRLMKTIRTISAAVKIIHTIIPGFITKDKNLSRPFGVMGGYAATGSSAGGDEPH